MYFKSFVVLSFIDVNTIVDFFKSCIKTSSVEQDILLVAQRNCYSGSEGCVSNDGLVVKLGSKFLHFEALAAFFFTEFRVQKLGGVCS